MKKNSSSLKLKLYKTEKYTLSFLILLSFAISGCTKSDNHQPAVGNEQPDKTGQNTVSGDSAGYMDKTAWEQAQVELKTVEDVIKSFNGFYDIWGWAYEHRTFLRFKEALETGNVPVISENEVPEFVDLETASAFKR